MITVSLSDSFSQFAESLSGLSAEAKDQLAREVATSVMAEMKQRVHVRGEASNGGPIGAYSASYLKLRTGLYKDAKVSKKGIVKSAGMYSKGASLGKSRKKYNRTADPKVILSLTRQMENDMRVMQIPGGYGIGYSNPTNLNKAIWNQTRYKKAIWQLSEAENQITETVIKSYLDANIR